MKLIERTFYLEQLKSVLNTPDIKVITGVRRSGKSKLLVSFIDWINENQDNANIVYINMQETERPFRQRPFSSPQQRTLR